jgi:mRNA-degrading endonuclease toxin of MazEF toxin-antitoxin module
MKRGDVYWVNLIRRLGARFRRHDRRSSWGTTLNAHRRTVLVVPLTQPHTHTLWPVLVAIKAGRPGCACIYQVKACDKRRFAGKVGALKAAEMDEISDALRYTLGFGGCDAGATAQRAV